MKALMPKHLLMLLAIVIVLALGIALILRPHNGEREAAQTVIRLYAGAGLKPPVHEAIERFQRRHDVRIEVDYGASNLLLSRLRLMEEGDLFLPGDAFYIDEAEALGLIIERRDIAEFVPVIQVQKGNPLQISAVSDLMRPGLRLAIADERAAAIGRLTPQIFALHDIDGAALAERVVFTSITAPELAQAVALGHADAAIVWHPVAMQYQDMTDTIAIPPEGNLISPVSIALLASSTQAEAAQAFMAFLLGPGGQDCFQRHHYQILGSAP